MKGALRDECVVVLPAESTCTVQCSRNAADSLELTPTITDTLFVHSECLCEEFVADLLEAGLIGDLARREEESECEFGDGGGRAA